MNTPTSTPSVVLILESDSAMRTSLTAMLSEPGLHLLLANDVSGAETLLHDHAIDVVVCDARFEIASGHTLVQRFRSRSPLTEFILIIGSEHGPSSIAAVRMGLCDYLAKPFQATELNLKVTHALQLKRMHEEIAVMREHVAMTYGFDNIVGISPGMTQLKELASRIAPTDIPILITGASGTGKELLARTIHHHSRRRQKRFVVIDCRAIPESLIEGELFGQNSGGPMTAVHARPGLLAEADGGTVFIDHVDALSPAMQACLLRFMQNFDVAPPGSERPRKVDTRVITACDENLQELAINNTFSAELWFRLGVIQIQIQPLAERPEDIDVMVDYLLRRASREMGRSELTLAPGVQAKLAQYGWPGNVRELENTLKRAVALSKNGVIGEDDIRFIGVAPGSSEFSQSIPERRRPLVETQRDIIRRTLELNDWNYTQTANELGIGRTTLWRKVKKFNLARQ